MPTEKSNDMKTLNDFIFAVVLMNCNISQKIRIKMRSNTIAEHGVNHNGSEALALKLVCFFKALILIINYNL
jgi:hypothetical protein